MLAMWIKLNSKFSKQIRADISCLDSTARSSETSPLELQEIQLTENVENKLNRMIAPKLVKLTAKVYYCTFYRSDIEPPDKGLR